MGLGTKAPYDQTNIFYLFKTMKKTGVSAPASFSVLSYNIHVFGNSWASYLPNSTKNDELRASQIAAHLQKGNFELRKWVSNSDDFKLMEKSAKRQTSVLGLMWDSERDLLQVKKPVPDEMKLLTKRLVLARVTQLFSPLGLIAPFIVKGKIQLARLHLLGPEWDDNLENKGASIALKEEAMWWREWFNKYQDVTEEQFARCLRPRPDELKETQMHCFVDASEEAFAAVIYTRFL